ncbi:MAG: alpha/beta fold hydrolase, partial [Oscillospiraceae bacterium]|nr:alpha/beta fold hydrolase [Oscillospiraceae bacterium]
MEERMLRFTSRFLGWEAEYALFLPKGEGPFKTLYLLHGYGGNARQWKEKSAVARLAAAHRLAVVMPGCGDGYYQDDPAAGVYTARFLAEELLPEPRRLFPLSPRRGDTFLGGVSMGGFGALLVGSRYGSLFGGRACFSSAFVVQELQQARLG